MWNKGRIEPRMYPYLRDEIERSPIAWMQLPELMAMDSETWHAKINGVIDFTLEEKLLLRSIIKCEDIDLDELFAKRKR